MLVAVIAIVFAFFSGGEDRPEVSFGEVLADAEENRIEKIRG
ncbi:MAG: hypothetical protein U5Q44_02170 [Dehalococcoidia bacterium]|nr:hypothetical protein [Dehalococcoidia bacterium]